MSRANERSEHEEAQATNQDGDVPLSSSEIEFYLKKIEAKMNPPTDSLVFDSIQTAASWFEINRASFSSTQQSAMETLVTARNQVNMGCSCKKHVRQRMADEYLKNFMVNNQGTDLIPSIKDAAKVPKIIVRFGTDIVFEA